MSVVSLICKRQKHFPSADVAADAARRENARNKNVVEPHRCFCGHGFILRRP